MVTAESMNELVEGFESFIIYFCIINFDISDLLECSGT